MTDLSKLRAWIAAHLGDAPARRIAFAAASGAVFGLGGLLALGQAGRGTATSTWIITLVVCTALSVLATVFATYRAVRVGFTVLTLASMALAVFGAQRPVGAQGPASSCGSLEIDGAAVAFIPSEGEPGSAGQPIPIDVVDGTSVQVTGDVNNPYGALTVGIQAVEPVQLGPAGINPEAVSLNGTRFDLGLTIVDGGTLRGLVIHAGDELLPVPIGVVQVVGEFSVGEFSVGEFSVGEFSADGGFGVGEFSADGAVDGPSDCRFAIHVHFLARASSTILGRVGLLLGALGAAGMLASAVSAWRSAPRSRPKKPQLPEPKSLDDRPPKEPSTEPGDTSGAGAGGAPPAQPSVPERLVQTQVEVDEENMPGFVTDEVNTLFVWIGPKILDELIQHSDKPIDQSQVPHAGLDLDVTLDWNGQTETRSMFLPASPFDKSKTVAFEVDLAGQTEFRGTLHFIAKPINKIFEVVRIKGPCGDIETTVAPTVKSLVRDRELLHLQPVEQHCSGAWWEDEGGLLRFGQGTSESYSATGLEEIASRLGADISAVQLPGEVTDWHESGVQALLHKMATYGANLFDELVLQGFDIERVDLNGRLQIYSADAKKPVPLEFVYDRGSVAKEFTIKGDCLDALRDPDRDICSCVPAATLTREIGVKNPELCPFGFWGISRVIERYSVDPDLMNPIPHPTAQQDELPPLTSALVGTSELVLATTEPVIDLTGDLARVVHEVKPVANWSEWQAAQRDNAAPLLVALPHHDTRKNYLEMGGQPLELHEVRDLHERDRPGGILLLMGCNTDVGGTDGFMSFAEKFQRAGTPIVVGTSAQIVTHDAARLAVTLISEMTGTTTQGRPFGEAMRATRQRLFADGFPIVLAVSALGDADWRFDTPAKRLVGRR